MTDEPENLYRCTPRQTRKFVLKTMEAGLVPFVHSSPGMGKSSIIKSVAKQMGLKVIDHRLSTSAPEDLSGLPQFIDGKASFAPFDIFPTESTPVPPGYNGWLLFLDEFNSADQSVQAAAYKLMLDQMVGQHKLHPLCLIAAAGNLSTDRAITSDLSTAMQSRVIHIEMQINVREWMEDVALAENYSPHIRSFIDMKPGSLMDFRPDHNEKTFACPRTWEFMERLCKVIPFPEWEAHTALFAGTITSGVAVAFVQFTKVFADLPSIADITRDPYTAKVPTDTASRFAITTMIVDVVTEDTFDNSATYVGRLPIENRIVFYRNLMSQKPQWRAKPIFAAAMLDLSQYLGG